MPSAITIDLKALPGPGLEGHTALITGGASGIGLSTARMLASFGIPVTITDLSPPKTTEQNLHYVHSDVTSYKSQLAAFKAHKAKFGLFPSLVFANAGIAEKDAIFGGSMDAIDIEQEPDLGVVSVDLSAVIYTVRIAWWGIKEEGYARAQKGGSIVVTASMAGYGGQPGLPVYNAAKHGTVGLVRSLSFLAPTANLSISLVAPAITGSPLLLQPIPYGAPSPAPAHSTNPAFAAPTQTQVEENLASAGVYMNTAEDVAKAVSWLFALGPKANGKGVLVQGGEFVDLEQGIRETRQGWMSERHLDMYRGGKGKKGAFELKRKREEKL